jgi:hypothetical protein
VRPHLLLLGLALPAVLTESSRVCPFLGNWASGIADSQQTRMAEDIKRAGAIRDPGPSLLTSPQQDPDPGPPLKALP